MSALVAIIAAFSIGTAGLGLTWAAAAQSANAADAAALAAAVATYPPANSSSPIVVAAQAARQNGAELLGCECRVDPGLAPRVVEVSVEVEVELPFLGSRTVTRSARAEFDPQRWLGG